MKDLQLLLWLPLLVTLTSCPLGGKDSDDTDAAADTDTDGDGYSVNQGDCDDEDAGVYPGAPEGTDDGVDQNCDGVDGVDADGDGDASTLSGGGDCDDHDPSLNSLDLDGDGYSSCHDDCDDDDPQTYWGAPEIDDDGIDQDCDRDTNDCRYDMDNSFPLDGVRSWRYHSDSSSLTYELQLDLGSPVTQGDWEVTPLVAARVDTGEWLYTMTWSSDDMNGVYLHGYESPNENWNLDPPVQLASRCGTIGQPLETSSGGAQFVSEFVAEEPCPNHWTDSWTCMAIELTASASSAPFTGEFWWARSYGSSQFQLVNDPGLWVLSTAEWQPSE